jgi:nitroreductase
MKPRPHFGHPVHELIQKRWSPRAFADRRVEPDALLSLFEAARWAASCMNEQPWRFIWAARSDTLHWDKLFSCLTEGNKAWVKTAPLLVLTLVRTTFARDGSANPWARHDLGLAMGNLTTQATAMDLYVHHMAGFSVETARRAFGLAPDVEPVTMAAIGYLGDPSVLPEAARKRELEPRERKPLAELLL